MSRSRTLRLLAGLALMPAVFGLALVVAPRLSLNDTAAAFGSFAFAAAASLGAVAILVDVDAPLALSGVLCALAIGALAACRASGIESPLTVAVVDTALVALGGGLGAPIGRRIEDAGHLLPACVVAACADFVSVISPSGPSHAIVANEHALALVAISFPVPGTYAVAPALGVGDLIFVALVLGAVRAHGLGLARTLALAWVGAMFAVACSYGLTRAVPALPTIGALVLAGTPAARRLRAKDRTAALMGMGIAIALCLGTVASRYWSG